jgi:hypothetical protein
MPSTAVANHSRPSFRTGFLVATAATVAWYFLLAASGLNNEKFVPALIIGTGLLVISGLLLAASQRFRSVGLGLAVGAPVGFVAVVAVVVSLLVFVVGS